MKECKRFSGLLCLLASFIMLMFLSCVNVNAAYYEQGKNKVVDYTVDRNGNKVTVSIEYQNGIAGLEVYICEKSNFSNCEVSYITKFVDANLDISSDSTKFQINNSEEVRVYYAEFTNVTDGDSLNTYIDKVESDGSVDNEYRILIKADYCIMRSNDASTCKVWDKDVTAKDEKFVLESGITTSGQLNTTIGKMLNIIHNIVIPILWGILGVILIVRGIMLGMDIVKSADEPEVRKKKVSGLIWLIIGIFVAYVITIAARVVMGMFGYGGYF